MARVAIPGGWAGALTRQRGPLRMYQWLWLLLCTAGALVVAAPRILSQPVIYTSTATASISLARYAGLYRNGQPNPEQLQPVENIAVELLKFRADGEAPRYPDLGSSTLGVRYEPQPDGSIRVLAVARGPAQAQRLAGDAAEAIARSIRAAGGREVFRVLTGSYLVNALQQGAAPATPFEAHLRTIFLTSAFPLNKPPDPDERRITVDQLDAETRSDLARALEVRDVELSKVDLPALQRGIADAGLDCRAARAAKGRPPQPCADEQRLITGLDAIRRAIGLLRTPFDPAAQSSAFISAPATPGAEAPRRVAALLALAALVGLLFGGAGVAVDRSAGVMAKARELWSYRELIGNLVLRDLRVRYKGSALGYLWTQLAPLMLMLVFLFVFSTLLPNTTSLYSVFLIVGLLAWNFCAEAVMSGTRSIIDNASLIKKVFFPREVLPLVSVLSSLLNYLLSLPMMLLVMGISQYLVLGRLNFAWTFAYLPVLLLIQTLFLAGIALFAGALAVHFRDFVHLIGILVQFWFFLTPVVYPLEAINRSIGGVPLVLLVRWANPMASLIEFYREILYGQAVAAPNVPTPGLPALTSVLRVLITAILMLAAGYWFFQRRSGTFGEEI
jgi:lipopolysaccharide transport system permease protein